MTYVIYVNPILGNNAGGISNFHCSFHCYKYPNWSARHGKMFFSRDLSREFRIPIPPFSPSMHEIHFQKKFFGANLPYHNIMRTKFKHKHMYLIEIRSSSQLSTTNILIGFKKTNDVMMYDIKLHGHITYVAAWKWNLLLVKCLATYLMN